MKICLIGNSHLAALKMGWPEIAQDLPDVQPAFFGARGAMMARLRVRGDRLVAKTAALAEQMSFVSGGLTEIVPGDYDAII